MVCQIQAILKRFWFFFYPLKLLKPFSSQKSPFQDFMMICLPSERHLLKPPVTAKDLCEGSWGKYPKLFPGPTLAFVRWVCCSWTDKGSGDLVKAWWRVVGEMLPDMPNLAFAAPVPSSASPDLLCTFMSKSYSSSVLQCLALHLLRCTFNDLKGIFQPKLVHDSVLNLGFP